MPYAEEVCRELAQEHQIYILTNSVEAYIPTMQLP